jgi:hypothetical protein
MVTRGCGDCGRWSTLSIRSSNMSWHFQKPQSARLKISCRLPWDTAQRRTNLHLPSVSQALGFFVRSGTEPIRRSPEVNEFRPDAGERTGGILWTINSAQPFQFESGAFLAIVRWQGSRTTERAMQFAVSSLWTTLGLVLLLIGAVLIHVWLV